MPVPELHLASSSPRRKELLAALGLEFTAAGVDVEETRLPGESPQAMVIRLAAAKAEAAAVPAETLVLGSDTAVVLGTTVFGKPRDEDDCLAILGALSGKAHEVMTGVALRRTSGIATVLSITEVRFREIGRDEALAYWQSGDPRDKAGAYGIQGRGGVFVESIRGSYSGVVGLPVFETAELLAAAGIGILSND